MNVTDKRMQKLKKRIEWADSWRKKIINHYLQELVAAPDWRHYRECVESHTNALGTPDPADAARAIGKYIPDLRTKYHVAILVAAAPPLTQAQLDALRPLFAGRPPSTEAERRVRDEQLEAELARLAGERDQITRAYRSIHGREGRLRGNDDAGTA